MKRRERNILLRIIGIYALFSCAWIYGSEHLMLMITSDKQALVRLGVYKGFLFIAISSALLYQLLSRYLLESTKLKEKIKEKDHHFTLMVDSLRDAYVCLDMNGRITRFNSVFQEKLGFEPEELLNMTYLDLTSDKDREYGKSIIEEQVLQRGYSDIYEKDYQRKDGTLFPVEVRTQLICDAAGNPSSMWAIIRDITARKQAELELLTAKLQYDNLVSRINVGIYLLHSTPDDGLYTLDYVSPRMSEILGYSVETLLANASCWFQNIYPDDYVDFITLNDNGIRLIQPFDFTFRYMIDGSIKWLHFESLPERRLGGDILWHGVVTDVTEQKQSELYGEIGKNILQILNGSEPFQETAQLLVNQLKTGTGCSAVGLRLQDGDDFPYIAQSGFPDHFLKTENALSGPCRDESGKIPLECTCGLVISGNTDPASPLFTPGGSFWTNDSTPLLKLPISEAPRILPRNICIYEGYGSFALIPIRKKDLIIGLIQLNNKRKGCFSKNTIELLEGIASHIGEAMVRKQIETELKKKTTEIEQFLYCVSHELRSPVVTIKTFMGFLEKDLEPGQEKSLTQDIEYINHAALRMQLLLDELLELSRINKTTVEPVKVNLQMLLADTLNILAGEIINRQANISLPATDIPLYGEYPRLLQIWQNLIGNAIKHTKLDVAPQIQIGVEQVDGRTIFSVKDNGIGIDPKYHQKIFGVFEKLNPKSPGAGLGLTMTQRIIENQTGEIWVESEGVGKGSCFYFTLPHAVNHDFTEIKS